MSTDPVAADYLGGHPDTDAPVADGELVVADGVVRFSGGRLEGLTPVRVQLDLPMPALTAVSVLDRGLVDTLRPLIQSMRWGFGWGELHRMQRDRLLLVATGDTVASFSLTVLGANRIAAAIEETCGVLPPVVTAPPGQDALLTEIRDLLARQVALLERLTARLAP